MSACLRDSQILQLVFGVTLETELEEVMEHLNACPDCRKRVESERAQHSSAQKEPSNLGSTTSRSGGDSDISATAALPTVDGYDILSRIHAGAQGVVYKAIQLSTSRTVAVKLLPHEHSATDRQKHRFEREVGLAASLRHSNIVTVYDSGLTSGRYFFAMEYIHGKPLDQYLKASSLSVPDKLRLFATICSAVNYAHQKGVIHRDLKPGNILVDAASQPHVVDFGLAKSAGVVAMHGDAPFTLTSQFMGTLAYASPEQTKGDPTLIDTRSDVYSLGIILYEMLTGTYPYPMNADLAQMFHTICHTPPKPPSSIASGLNQDLDTIVLRALAKEPDRRYQTVADMQADVERWLGGEPISARRDSLPYLVRLKSRRFIQRRPVTAYAVAAIVAFLAAEFGVSRFVYNLTQPINGMFVRMLSATLPAIPAHASFKNVRVIGLMPDTDFEAIAKNEGLNDVMSQPMRSVRRLHGRFMKKMVDASPAVFSWDIRFPEAAIEANDPDRENKAAQAAAFDVDFVAGIRALQDKDIQVILPNDSWSDEAQRRPNLAQAILGTKPRFGGITTNVGSSGWTVDLAVKRGSSEAMKSLALESIAALRMPDFESTAHLNSTTKKLHLLYHTTSSEVPHLRVQSAYEDGFDYFGVAMKANPDTGILAGDVVVEHLLLIPPREVVENSTLSYQQVMNASTTQLKNWFQDKIVIIGDMDPERNGGCPCVEGGSCQLVGDVHRTPDGWPMWGCQSHALAVENLLSQPAVRYARQRGRYVFTGAAAVAGVCAAVMSIGRRRLRWAYIAACIALTVLVCVVAMRGFDYLVLPHVPIAAIIVAVALVALTGAQLTSANRSLLRSASSA